MSSNRKKNRGNLQKQQQQDQPQLQPSTGKKAARVKSSATEPTSKLLRQLKWAVFLLPFLLYANTLSNGYSMDDELVTTEVNQLTSGGLANVPTILTSMYSENDSQAFEYRPVVLISFALEHQLFGTSAAMSHFIEILLYAWLCLIIFKTSMRIFPALGPWFHFTVALFFIFHPLHTEVVASIKSRDELLAFIFALLSLNAFISHAASKKSKYLVFALLFFLLAWLSKRSCMPYIAVIPVAVYFANLFPVNEKGYISWSYRGRLVFYGFVLFVLAFGSQKIINHLLLGDDLFVREAHYFENPLYVTKPGLLGKMGMAGYTIAYYFKLFLLPITLVAYYGYSYVEYVGWGSWMSFAGFFATIGLTALALYRIRKREPWALGVLMMLMSLSLFSNLVKPAVGIIAERFAFEASLGFAFIAAWLLMKLTRVPFTIKKWPKEKPVFGGLLVLIMFLYGFKTVTRNTDWKSQKSIYAADVVSAPNSAKLQSLLASVYTTELYEAKLGKRVLAPGQDITHIDSAIRSFRAALKVYPEYASVNNNLGMVYYTYRAMIDSAEYYFERALKKRPDYLQAHFNMANIYEQRFLRKAEAVAFLKYTGSAPDTAPVTIPSREVKMADSILQPMVMSSLKFKNDVINFVRSYARNAQNKGTGFEPQVLIGSIHNLLVAAHQELELPAPPNQSFAEVITREIKTLMRQQRKQLTESMDSLGALYFFPMISKKVNDALIKQGIKVPGGPLLSYEIQLEKQYRTKAYNHWKRTLEIECTYTNSYEKLKEWHGRMNEPDSMIALNNMMLQCRNYKKGDVYWALAHAWMDKGDTARAMEYFEKMLLHSDKLLNRYQLAIGHFSAGGNALTSQMLANNLRMSIASIYKALTIMRRYYVSVNQPANVQRMDERLKKIGMSGMQGS